MRDENCFKIVVAVLQELLLKMTMVASIWIIKTLPNLAFRFKPQNTTLHYLSFTLRSNSSNNVSHVPFWVVLNCVCVCVVSLKLTNVFTERVQHAQATHLVSKCTLTTLKTSGSNVKKRRQTTWA